MTIHAAAVDWTPVVQTSAGGFLALAGVAVTLWVTGRRGERESGLRREDDARSKAREATAQLLAAARTYERHARALGDPTGWITGGYERATAIADQTEASMALMHERLIGAQLILSGESLDAELVPLEDAFHSTAAVVHEIVDAFWEARVPSLSVAERDLRWGEWNRAMNGLARSAMIALRPTIREHRPVG